mmetsp:Transcript_45989/g.72050  ORF Transcript_45989/g.72050 Transcript_45989/m.72050 type:complete len:183 (+) Transcript_45989:232-780(+)
MTTDKCLTQSSKAHEPTSEGRGVEIVVTSKLYSSMEEGGEPVWVEFRRKVTYSKSCNDVLRVSCKRAAISRPFGALLEGNRMLWKRKAVTELTESRNKGDERERQRIEVNRTVFEQWVESCQRQVIADEMVHRPLRTRSIAASTLSRRLERVELGQPISTDPALSLEDSATRIPTLARPKSH